jgi:hypothetical protein
LTSADVRVYCLLVAPPIAAQLPPEVSQRCQAYAKLVGEFVQEPFEAVSSEPSFAEPLIDGRDVFAGTAWPTADPTPTSTLAVTANAPPSTAILLVKLIGFLPKWCSPGGIPVLCKPDVSPT